MSHACKKRRTSSETCKPLFAVLKPFIRAFILDDADMVERLLDSPDSEILDLDRLFGGRALGFDGTLLHHAASHGGSACVAVLLQRGASVHVTNSWDSTPLHNASSKGCVGSVELLLLGGSSVDARDREDCTPLHLAARSLSVEVIGTLLRWGADPGAKDSSLGSPPLLFAMSESAGQYLMFKKRGRKDSIDLLLNSGADPCATDFEGRTSLHFALDFECGDEDIVKSVLMRGAYIEQLDGMGDRPLQSLLKLYAAGWQGSGQIRFLISMGAEVSLLSTPRRPWLICTLW